jgi:hypothetical protein
MSAQAKLRQPPLDHEVTGDMNFRDMRALLDRLEAVSQSQALRDAAEMVASGARPVETELAPRKERTMSDTGLAHSTANKPTFADTLAKVKDLGEQAGKGVDTQIKFFLATCEAAFLNVIDLDPDKHGKGIDDATKLSDEYTKAQSGASIFSTKAARKTISTTKLSIKLGMFTKGGPGEPLQTLNNLMTIWRKERARPENKGQMVDAFNTATKFAREQLKRQTMIGDAELRGFCFKPGTDHKTAEEVLDHIRKQLRALRDGKASKGTALDNSPEIETMIKAADKRMKEIAKAKAPQSGMATPSKQSTTAPTQASAA